MTKDNMDNDNWRQMLSDFGIEDTVSETPAELAETVVLVVSEVEVESVGDAAKPKDKKTIFSRFPKINFFGAPPEVSLDSVSLDGKAFTDNKLEKVPLSQEWTDKQTKDTAGSDALSAVASQIDSLASGERAAKRRVASMFDDPVPESEEFRTLKNIMGTPRHPSREEAHGDTYAEEETDSDSWRRERGRGRQKPQSKEREPRGRGSRYQPQPPVEVDDLPKTDFRPIDDEEPRTRGRGQRGSRYAGSSYREREPIQDDPPQEEWSEVDVALQGRGEPPVQRGGRRQRYDKRRGAERPERTERPAFDREEPSDMTEDSGIVAFHGNVPSWDEAIGDIITGNIARHKSQGHQSHSGRGRR